MGIVNRCRVVVVPDLSPAELVVWANRKIGFTRLNNSLTNWDFTRYRVDEGQPARFLEVRNRRYEVLTWEPRRRVSTQGIREHFHELGADGNTAAFIAWITKINLTGRYASIPSDDALLFRTTGGVLYALYFVHRDTHCELDMRCVGGVWNDFWSFVAFRAIYS